jgi:cytochrome c553
MRSLVVAPKSQIYVFAPTRHEPFEIGAMLVAILAFPGHQEIDARERAFEALCANTVCITCKTDWDHRAGWSARFPAYAAIDAAESRRRLRTLHRRLRDRMKAAQIALGFFDEAARRLFASIAEAYPDLKAQIGDVAARPTPLPAGVARHSLNALIRYHSPQSNDDGWHNQEHRIWRSSLPVIHLATAVHVLGRHLRPEAERFEYKLDDLDLHRRVVALANVHEEVVCSEWERHASGLKGSSTFSIDPRMLIRCRIERASTRDF